MVFRHQCAQEPRVLIENADSWVYPQRTQRSTAASRAELENFLFWEEFWVFRDGSVEQCFWNVKMEAIISRACYNSDPDSLNCALVPRPCIATKLPQGALAAAPRTTLWVARTQRFLSYLGLKAKAPQPNTVLTLSHCLWSRIHSPSSPQVGAPREGSCPVNLSQLHTFPLWSSVLTSSSTSPPIRSMNVPGSVN